MVIRLRARPSRIALSSLMILSFLLASWAAMRPWVAQRALSRGSIDQAASRALSLDPGNDRIQATLAALYHYSLLLRDYPAALTAYRSILRNNPLDSASWLHLGKLYASLNQARESDQAFALAARFGPSNSALLWEIAIAHLDEGQVTEAMAILTRFLAVSPPNDASRGYELARRLASPDEVLEKMIAPDAGHYTHYSNYLLDRNLGDQALAVWDRLHQMATRTREPIDPHLQLRMVDLFMLTGQIDPAHQLWTAVTRQIAFDNASTESNPVSNGSFERDATLGRGFDWRIGGAPGIVATVDPFMAYTGRRSLRLSFTKSRVDFSNVSQLIPVHPHSTYALQAHIRTDGFTGPKGLTVEVIDPHDGVLARTDLIGGTRDWTPVVAQFRTSGAAQTVILRVHSEPPPPYLPSLSGSAWIDNVSLTKVN